MQGLETKFIIRVRNKVTGDIFEHYGYDSYTKVRSIWNSLHKMFYLTIYRRRDDGSYRSIPFYIRDGKNL